MKRAVLSATLILAFAAALVVPLRAQTEPGPLRMMVRDILNLTPDQEAKLDEMIRAQRAERQDYLDRMEKMSGELRALLRDPNGDRKRAEGLIDDMARLRAERMKTRLRHRDEMRTILTPEQRKKLDEYRESFAARRRDGARRPLGRFGGGFGRRFPRFRSWWW